MKKKKLNQSVKDKTNADDTIVKTPIPTKAEAQPTTKAKPKRKPAKHPKKENTDKSVADSEDKISIEKENPVTSEKSSTTPKKKKAPIRKKSTAKKTEDKAISKASTIVKEEIEPKPIEPAKAKVIKKGDSEKAKIQDEPKPVEPDKANIIKKADSEKAKVQDEPKPIEPAKAKVIKKADSEVVKIQDEPKPIEPAKAKVIKKADSEVVKIQDEPKPIEPTKAKVIKKGDSEKAKVQDEPKPIEPEKAKLVKKVKPEKAKVQDEPKQKNIDEKRSGYKTNEEIQKEKEAIRLRHVEANRQKQIEANKLKKLELAKAQNKAKAPVQVDEKSTKQIQAKPQAKPTQLSEQELQKEREANRLKAQEANRLKQIEANKLKKQGLANQIKISDLKTSSNVQPITKIQNSDKPPVQATEKSDIQVQSKQQTKPAKPSKQDLQKEREANRLKAQEANRQKQIEANKLKQQELEKLKQQAIKSEPKKEPTIKDEKPVEKKTVYLPKAINYYNLPTDLKLTDLQKSHPAVIKVISEVEKFINMEMYVYPNLVMTAAISGGVDSTVMLDVLAILSEKYFYKLTMAHYNHKLREISDEDEAFVANLATRYKLEFSVARGNVKTYSEKNSMSIEQAARILRYNFFEKTTRTQSASYLTMAHTKDDTVETFLINLLRGSGLTGLSGIPVKRSLVKNVVIVRPMIELKKSDLIEYAAVRNLKWVEDETNSLVNFTRNKVRNQLIPFLTSNFSQAATDTIARTTKLLHSADMIINDIVSANFAKVVTQESVDRFSINIALFKTFNDYLQGEFIQLAVNKYFRMQPLPLSTIDRILSMHDLPVGAIIEINKYYIVLRDRNELIFTRKNEIEKVKQFVNCPGDFAVNDYNIELRKIRKNQAKFTDSNLVEFFDADLIPDKLEVRTWDEGDVFQPLGMDGTMKVSDYLTNVKMPLIDKTKVQVMVAGGEIIWLIGHRISNKFKITDSTTKYIRAEMINKV
jgi:tRNA(Ile)-lysidine synthase